jgi:hypothetical protein
MTTGRCLCGAVQFTVASVEIEHHACHCGMCRRWSGGPLLAAAASGVTFQGKENLGRYSGSEWAERGFCKRCGSSLFYRLKPADRYLMCVGSFDDAAPFTLTREIFVDHKPAGYAFAGDLQRKTEAEIFAEYGGQ